MSETFLGVTTMGLQWHLPGRDQRGCQAYNALDSLTTKNYLALKVSNSEGQWSSGGGPQHSLGLEQAAPSPPPSSQSLTMSFVRLSPEELPTGRHVHGVPWSWHGRAGTCPGEPPLLCSEK